MNRLHRNALLFGGLAGFLLSGLCSPLQAQTDRKALCDSLAARPGDKQLLRDLKTAIADTPDINLKVKLGAIYCLGCLVNGLETEWSQTYAQLKNHYPGNEHVNLLSLEAIGDVCPECGGATYIYKECARCKGTAKCAMCGGKGSISGRAGGGEKPCSICKGSGDCAVCSGSGAVKMPCARCVEKGRIWSPTAANEIYLKLLKGADLKKIQADVNERKAIQAREIEKAVAVKAKEKEYRKFLKSMDEKTVQAKLRIIKVIGKGAMVSGAAAGVELPQQFLVDQLKDVVDGDNWEGKIYPMGRVQVRGPGGMGTFRVYTTSKEQAAMAALLAQDKEDPGKKPSEGTSTGTGWFCGIGQIVTCYHVVVDRNQIAVVSGTLNKTPVKLILKDEAHDLAILEPITPIKAPPGIPLAKENPQLGEGVFTIGFPHIGLLGKEPKFTDGTISSLAGLQDDPRTLQVSVPVQAGNSGGPLMNLKGEVVGVVASKLAAANIFRWTGDLPQNVNYAVKVQYLQKLLDVSAGSKPANLLPAEKAPAVDLAKRVQTSIVQVLAE